MQNDVQKTLQKWSGGEIFDVVAGASVPLVPVIKKKYSYGHEPEARASGGILIHSIFWSLLNFINKNFTIICTIPINNTEHYS